MPDLPIAPDPDTLDCLTTCPQYRITPRSVAGACAIDPEMGETDMQCKPRIRELVALSRRRCDGCHRFSQSPTRHSDGTCPLRVGLIPPDGHCEDWEAKP